MTARAARALVPAIVFLLVVPALLFAHQSLRSSEPEKDARLTMVPSELRLTFAEPVDLGLTRILLLGPAGDTVALGPLDVRADSPRVVRTELRGRLVAGAYLVRWMTAGSDGHPTTGDFAFEILPEADGLSAATPQDTMGGVTPPPATTVDAVAFTTSSPLYVAVRWLLYTSVLLAVGAVAFRLIVLGALRRGFAAMPRWLDDAGLRAARVGLLASGGIVIAAVLRLVAQAAALRAAGLSADGDRLTTMLVSTLWGWGWLLQLLAAALLAAGFIRARGQRPFGWMTAAAGALLLCITPGLSGHAAAAARPDLAVTADALHVLGASGWLGSLAVVMLAGVPAAMRLEGGDRGRAVLDLINAFSPAALAFAALLVATGVIAAWIHLGSLTMLWSSEYGRMLLIKLGWLVPLVATAAFNWRRVRPRLGDMAGALTLRRSAAVEVTLGAIVLLVTAALVAIPIESPRP